MMHFLFVAVAFFLTVAASAPAPAFSQMPTVQLRITGPEATRYIPSTQKPSSDGHIIEFPIGISLSSLEQNPLLLQGLEIVRVDGDVEVFCKANINHSSKGIMVSTKEQRMILLNHVVQVTGLSCGFGSGSV